MVCLLAPALAACTERSLAVEFAETPITPAEVDSWTAVTVRSAHHEVLVRRTMTTPSWCRDLEADVVQTGSDVTLRVSAMESDDACPAGEGLWGYLAEIRGLRPGRYNLRVVHTFADPRRPSVVELTQPVVVD